MLYLCGKTTFAMTEKTSFRHSLMCVNRHTDIHTASCLRADNKRPAHHRINRTLTAFMFILFIGLYGCSHGNTCRYDSPEEALADYAAFLKKIDGKKRVTTSDLIALTKEWHTLGDSVSSSINRCAMDSKVSYTDRFAVLGDSISSGMNGLVESRPRSFSDYLSVLSALNKIEKDSASLNIITSVHRFYDKAGAVPVHAGDARAVIRYYERILDTAIDSGFHSKQDVIRFLHDEDVAFRSFLIHLPELGDFSLESISSKSKILTARMFNLTSEHHAPLFSKTEIVLMLTIRQNRRVILNAHKCLEDLRTCKFTDSNQQTAYLWMILQPWIIIDGFSYSLLSEEQLDLLEAIAGETGNALKKLPDSRFPIDVDELPSTLIKTCILYPDK